MLSTKRDANHNYFLSQGFTHQYLAFRLVLIKLRNLLCATTQSCFNKATLLYIKFHKKHFVW